MTKTVEKLHQLREKRKLRVRKRLRGTQAKPRLSVAKTNKHIHAQLIDDVNGMTLASASTVSLKCAKNREGAKMIGETIGKAAANLNIKEAVFDRGASQYRGILEELANGARSAGLNF